MSDETQTEPATYNVKLEHVVKQSNTDNAKLILVMLGLFFIMYILVNGGFILSYAGAMAGIGIMMLISFAIGGALGNVWGNKPQRVKYLNMIMSGANFHIVQFFKSGKRTTSHVVNLGKENRASSLEVGKRRYIIDQTEVRMHDGVPTLCFDERTCQPLNFDSGSVDYKKSPELFSIAIQKERELARLQVTNWAKTLQLILWIIVGVGALNLLVSGINYLQLGDVAKNAQALAAQAIQTAQKVVK